ncbi:MAG: hypothetical protein HGA80_08875, partial [Candidatus Omnitrophica bacterium]|nr:hypothetical protein [Candidatus Omnitrophota bacterium]
MSDEQTQVRTSVWQAFPWAYRMYAGNWVPLLSLSWLGSLPGFLFQMLPFITIKPDNVVIFLLGVISFLASSLSFLSMILAMQDAQSGQVRSVSQLVAAAGRRLISYMGVVALSCALFIVPAVFLTLLVGVAKHWPAVGKLIMTLGVLASWLFLMICMMMLVFTPFMLLLQDAGIVNSMQGSWRISRRNFWPIFGVLLTLTVAALFIFLLFSLLIFLKA